MRSIRDAMLGAIQPDLIIKVNDIEGNKKKKDKVFNEIKNTLLNRYTIFADTTKDEILLQYKR